jgi:hypothetical protein
MRLDCVQGELKGTKADIFQLIETTWRNWKNMYSQTRVLSRNTGHSRNYGVYPYGNYKTDHQLFLFPVSPRDNRLPAKERVLGLIIDGKVKVYRFSAFPGSGVGMILDRFNGSELVITGSDERNFMVAFQTRTEIGNLVEGLKSVSNEGEIILEDEEGNQWNIFGEALTGPKSGQQLIRPVSFIGFYFAWGAFYPDLEIYQSN